MKRLAVLCVVFLAAGCGSTKTLTVTQTVTKTVTKTVAASSACAGSSLSASFAEQAGSAGAGQITYVLKLTNTSSSACELTITSLQLLDAKGSGLPTNATPPAASTLRPGVSVSYEARFSPDIAGTGDNQTGPCQPTASTLRVSVAGGGTADAPIQPPTSVCEKGTMTLRAAA
jgi:hypothetical protein